MGGVGSVSRSLGQIFEKACERSRSHIFGPISIKLAQNVSRDKFFDEIENGLSQVNK